jgi:hypothetical protein
VISLDEGRMIEMTKDKANFRQSVGQGLWNFQLSHLFSSRFHGNFLSDFADFIDLAFPASHFHQSSIFDVQSLDSEGLSTDFLFNVHESGRNDNVEIFRNKVSSIALNSSSPITFYLGSHPTHEPRTPLGNAAHSKCCRLKSRIWPVVPLLGKRNRSSRERESVEETGRIPWKSGQCRRKSKTSEECWKKRKNGGRMLEEQEECLKNVGTILEECLKNVGRMWDDAEECFQNVVTRPIIRQ